MDSVEKGRVAEAHVIASLVDQGHEVYTPVFGNGSCDIIAQCDGRLVRCEVKYTSCRRNTLSWEVSLRHTRHNLTEWQSKKFDATRCDVIAVYIFDLDRVMYLSAREYEGRTSVNVTEEMAKDFRFVAL